MANSVLTVKQAQTIIAKSAAAMFKDMEDPAQIEALKRRYGLDITNIELNAEKLRAAQKDRITGQKLATESFVTRWNSYLDSDPLLDKTTNGSLRITKVGEGDGDYAGLGRVLTNTALPEKAKELVTGFKQERATIKANYSKVVAEMVNPVKMEDAFNSFWLHFFSHQLFCKRVDGFKITLRDWNQKCLTIHFCKLKLFPLLTRNIV